MKRAISIFLCILCVFGLAGCRRTLLSGASVHLTVETDAAQYTVSASYGEIEGAGDAYTVRLPDLRDLLITVSAEGYSTVNIPISVEELLAGDVERTATLRRKRTHEVTVSVEGGFPHPAVSCGEISFSFRDGAFTGLVTEDEMRQGVIVTADGAEPFPIFFSEEELERTFLERAVSLTAAGTKLLEIDFPGRRDSLFALDEAGNLLPCTEMSSLNGLKWRVTVPQSYVGKVFFRPLYPVSEDDFYAIEARDTAAYGNFYTLTGKGTDSAFFSIDYDAFALYLDSWNDLPVAHLWVETDALLCPLPALPDSSYSIEREGNTNLIKVTYNRRETLRRLFINDPFGETAVTITPSRDFARGDDVLKGGTLQEGGIQTKPQFGIVLDEVTLEPYAGNIVLQTEAGQELLTGNGGPFPWREDLLEGGGALFVKEGSLLPVTDRGYYLCDEAEYLRVFTCRGHAQYRVKLSKGGVPLTGATVMPRFRGYGLVLPCIEVEPGVYENEQGLPFGYDIAADGKTYTVAPPASHWSRDGHLFTAELDLADPIGIVFGIQLVDEYLRLSELLSLTPRSEAVPVRIYASDYALYVRCSYLETIAFDAAYEAYGTTVTHETRRVEVEASQLLSAYCDAVCLGNFSRPVLNLSDWPLVSDA